VRRDSPSADSLPSHAYLRAIWWPTSGFGAEINLYWRLLVLLLHHPPNPLPAPNTASWPPINTTRTSHFSRSRVLYLDYTYFITLSHCLNLRPKQNGSNLNSQQGVRRSECCAHACASVYSSHLIRVVPNETHTSPTEPDCTRNELNLPLKSVSYPPQHFSPLLTNGSNRGYKGYK
jgi:hypothetical protein